MTDELLVDGGLALTKQEWLLLGSIAEDPKPEALLPGLYPVIEGALEDLGRMRLGARVELEMTEWPE